MRSIASHCIKWLDRWFHGFDSFPLSVSRSWSTNISLHLMTSGKAKYVQLIPGTDTKTYGATLGWVLSKQRWWDNKNMQSHLTLSAVSHQSLVQLMMKCLDFCISRQI